MFKSSGAQLTIVGLVASMLAIAPDAAWSQAAPPPTLGLQSPAQQSAPAQPTQPAEPPPASRDENPGLINEIGNCSRNPNRCCRH
jgi:hypothetical protein